ncbi:MAG: 50S ribosomal protein L10 [Clostridia bacterium]|nr:50S ribosomal protein L10 [Clostridia bacterium]
MASEKVLAQKQEEVSKLAEKIKSAKLVLLTDYRGITVTDVTNLRADLRKTSSEYTVIKNNITRRALVEAGIEGLDEQLIGPTAVILNTEDYLPAIKVVYKFIKANDFYKIKGGIIDGKLVSVEEIMTLAKLPSREELLSKLAGGLLGTIAKLAVGLEQVRLQKEQA